MKAKRLVKKSTEVPSRLRKKLTRFLRKSKSAILHTRSLRQAKSLAKMEIGKAARLLFKFVHFQVSIRPRIRLVPSVIFALVLALIASTVASQYIKSRESEIKINGQAILVAQEAPEREPIPEIGASIASKRSPFDFVKPANGYISQGFRGYHRAIDITGTLGSGIRPLGKGKVEFTGYMADGRGNAVIVDHGEGLKSLYAHMGRSNVGVGDEVTSDSTLGTIGLTGRTTGPHVHVEVYDNGISVDPAKLLPE